MLGATHSFHEPVNPLALVPSAFKARVENRGRSMSAKPLCSLAITWVLLTPLLLLAAGGGFSFEFGTLNTQIGYSGVGLTAINASGSSLLRFQAYVLSLFCGLLAIPAIPAILRGLRENLLLSLLVCYAFCSVCWSQNPRMTIAASGFLAVNVALAFYLLWRFDSNDVMKLIMLVGTTAAVGSLLLILFLPQYGTQLRGSYANGAWQGIFGHKNACAAALTYLLTPAFFVRLSGRFSWVFRTSYVLILIGIIAMARSVGGLVSCFCTIGFILLLLQLKNASGKDLASFIFIIVTVVTSLALLAFLNLESLLALFGKELTLTGRTALWHHLFQSIVKRPFTGFGYMAFWQGLHGESGNIWRLMKWPGIMYAENGIIELCLDLGFIGVVMFVAVFARAIRDAVYCMKRNATPATMWYLSILCYAIVTNIAGGKVLYPSYLECILEYIAFIGLRQERQKAEARTCDEYSTA